jgi:2-polyprenyl-3-methyl-5-hydroxy-6-metoxy-1,4-benzoquinol methylase
MLLMANRDLPHPEEAAQRPSRRAHDADPELTDVAEAVRAFYDRHPYPPPISNLDRHRELYQNPDRRRALSLLLWPTEKQRANQEILIAGCGTSQAATYALREPDARITAIDISETSLRYTRDLQRRNGLPNLELRRLAIEQVEELGGKFDQIVCTGVLHHLPDPDTGLRALRSVLAPNGAMHLMVYAAYGRADIYMMQNYYRLLGVGASEEELRDLGTTIGALPATIRSPACRGGRRISEIPTRSLTCCFTLRIAPTPCRSSMHGLSAAACHSGVGTSRPPISRNAGQWRACRMPCASARFLHDCSTAPSCCAERWSRTTSSPIATIALARASRLRSTVTPGRAMFLCVYRETLGQRRPS